MDSEIPKSVQRLDVAEEWRLIQTLRTPYQETAALLKKEQEMAKALLSKIQIEMGKEENVELLPGDLIEVTFRWEEWDAQDPSPNQADHQQAYKILEELFGEGKVKAIPNANSGAIRSLDFAVMLPL